MAAEAKRVALVIANAAYKIGRPLANPLNDAAVMKAALARLGFDPVIRYDNLGLLDMGRALADFSAQVEDADIAVIYFAGHGMEVNGENYLLPIDAELEHARHLPHETKTRSEAIDAVNGAAELGLIILDACRENPYRVRMRGLENVRSSNRLTRYWPVSAWWLPREAACAKVKMHGNTLVAYAAEHGTHAMDGPEGGNSPYVQALKEHIETPGLEVKKMFGLVRDRVLELTRNAQKPYTYGSLGGVDIYLKNAPPCYDTEKIVDVERAQWEEIRESTDPSNFEGFLENFQSGQYKWLARTRAEERIKECRHPLVLRRFIRKYPESARSPLAQMRLRVLKWNEIKNSRDPEDFESFLMEFSGGRYSSKAEVKLTALRNKDRLKTSLPWREAAIVIGAAFLVVGGNTLWHRLPAPSSRVAGESYLEEDDNKAFKAATIGGTKLAFEGYLDKYYRHAKEAMDQLGILDEAAYVEASHVNTTEAFRSYHRNWRQGAYQGRHLFDARQQIDALELKAGKVPVEMRTGIGPRTKWLQPGTGESFNDCIKPDRLGGCVVEGPPMVVVPSGRFTMGSAKSETGHKENELQQEVPIVRQIAVAKYAVTRGEFAAFVKAKEYIIEEGCVDWTKGRINRRGKRMQRSPAFMSTQSWRSPGFAFEQGDNHPVVCVSWDDANAYANWLSETTRQRYRLLSETEREYVTRTQTRGEATMPFWWGAEITPDQANYDYPGGNAGEGRKMTVPVHQFSANPWGLYQVHGNVWEWTADCWSNDRDARGRDDITATSACDIHVVRGGSWINKPEVLRAASRFGQSRRSNHVGFRVAREL